MLHLHTFVILTTAVAAYPSQVDQDSIQVKFSEDTREGFFGYSVANLSWQRRPGTGSHDVQCHAICCTLFTVDTKS